MRLPVVEFLHEGDRVAFAGVWCGHVQRVLWRGVQEGEHRVLGQDLVAPHPLRIFKPMACRQWLPSGKLFARTKDVSFLQKRVFTLTFPDQCEEPIIAVRLSGLVALWDWGADTMLVSKHAKGTARSPLTTALHVHKNCPSLWYVARAL